MWDLDRSMHSHLAPTVYRYGMERARVGVTFRQVLAEVYADQLAYNDEHVDPLCEWDRAFDDAMTLTVGCLIDHIVANAIEYGATTNGGHEVYMHPWLSIEWCTEDAMQNWYAA